jgi:shikimate dehydrogenase
MKKTFGLLGEKLGHSFSPLIHGMLGDYNYPLYEIQSGELDAFMTERRFDGCNVTIPYKQAVIPYCATLSEEAQRIGSVNTIVRDGEGLLHGHNTDYDGFRELFNSLASRTVRGIGSGVTLVLGDGGSARTVRAVLDRCCQSKIVTVSRRGENHYGNISRHRNAEIIINTTPVGMYPNNGESPLNLDGFMMLNGVVDLIYNPMRTKLLLDAERLGVPCVNGLAMLVAQAEMASRIFTGAPARPELVDKIIRKIRKKTQNIALIGMPGCGKSTIGRLLAEMTNRPFIDIDERVEAAAGKSIPDIFSQDGEGAFRAMETRILAEETKKSGVAIAAGGGVVTRAENLDLLRQNSAVVYLRRELSELSSDGRPLSQSIGIAELAERRLPLYEEWRDYAVDILSDPRDTVKRILEGIF